ncbi:hypothetical protein LCGC14_1037200 [marine sediment metagenome]|uniref:ClpX-type ZB domain-containing protein n=1 Tax=marine sediment metagenome TaxID=412755 RepID=A0A0F9MXF0_9ZZZZ
MSNKFTCANCDKTFGKVSTEEEVMEEKERLWGDISLDECVIICDDCFNNAMKRFN